MDGFESAIFTRHNYIIFEILIRSITLLITINTVPKIVHLNRIINFFDIIEGGEDN